MGSAPWSPTILRAAPSPSAPLSVCRGRVGASPASGCFNFFRCVFFGVFFELFSCASLAEKIGVDGRERSIFSILSVRVKNVGAAEALLKVVVSG